MENEALQTTQEKVFELPPDPPAPGQQFGPRRIELAINLGRELGIRYTALSPSPKDRLPLVEELAERLGMPRGIVTDGGKNLREPIGAVKNKGKSLLGLRDVKHLLANALESVVGEGWPYWPVTSIANCDAAGKISERGYLHVRTGNGLKTSGGGTRQGSS